jgi:hypothetical protein
MSRPQPPEGKAEIALLTSPGGIPPQLKQLRDDGRVAAAGIEEQHTVFGLGPGQDARYAAANYAEARLADRTGAPVKRQMTVEEFRERLRVIDDAMQAEKDKDYCGARGCLRSIFNRVFGNTKTKTAGRRRRHHKGKKTLKRTRRSTRRTTRRHR